MACTSKYIYSNCSTVAVGCTLYTNNTLSTPVGAGYHKIPVGTGQKTFTTNSSGVVTAETQCSWSASYTYAPLFTGTKNNCVAGSCTVSGSTVNLNDGSPQNAYSGYATYTSYVSQADADYQAQTAAVAMFESTKQDAINSRGYCTYTYSSGSGTYSANFTKNNCAANCDPNGSVSYSYTASGYSAQSTVSCEDAQSQANTAAYNAAVSYVNTNGQAYANANGSCCCWVAASTAEKCDGCNYRGNREKNQCTGAFRNDGITAYNSCTCGVGCAGTYYGNSYCSGSDSKDRTYYETYNCDGSSTGNSYVVNCGCNDGSQQLNSTGSVTCVDCIDRIIYLDTNRCSGTAGHYFVNGSDVGTTMPNVGYCNNTPAYDNYIGIRCVSGTNYDVYANTNPCGNYRYKYVSGNETNYTNDGGIFGSACTFSAYRSGTFTRNNCGSGYIGGSVSYSNTYYYSGINNQSGADAIADANFNNDGQNYANANGSCTAIPVCYDYNIVAYTAGVTVSGTYTSCAGGASSFSFYAYSSGVVGSVSCAQQGSVNVTSGNGTKTTGAQC